MILFNSKKIDPIVRLKLKEKNDSIIPVIITMKESPSKKIKNSILKYRGKVKCEYNYINSLGALISLEGVDRLSELPEISAISYDRKASVCLNKTADCIGMSHTNPCSQTGRNVNIAIIDTGVYPHGDLLRPHNGVLSFKDYINSCTEPYDDNGHGTHICGIVAGSGSMSDGKYKGIAPNSRIAMLKAFNSVGEGSFSDILAAIGWVIENRKKHNIKLLCLPFGADAVVPYKQDPLCMACEAAWNQGIAVIAASGNKGPDAGSITTPGIDPLIITAGCLGCIDPNMRNWRTADFSGRGSRKEGHIKPDLVAPGVDIQSLSCDKSYFPETGRRKPNTVLESPYSSMTGSSVSAAVAAGCAALAIEKMPDISPKDLKGILKLSCQTLNESKTIQGAGIIDLKKLLND